MPVVVNFFQVETKMSLSIISLRIRDGTMLYQPVSQQEAASSPKITDGAAGCQCQTIYLEQFLRDAPIRTKAPLEKFLPDLAPSLALLSDNPIANV